MVDLPPGFRFYPTEEELISFYMHYKLEGTIRDLNRVIPVVDIYKFNPWELPQLAGEFSRGDPEQWFFFIPRQEKEARGGRPNRQTNSGFWKATGTPGHVFSRQNQIIGLKRTMVFHRGRAPSGQKTEWKMNEYRAIQVGATSSSNSGIPQVQSRKEFSLCRVYIKSQCLRAFDRRPSEVVIAAPTFVQAHPSNHEATTSHQKRPTLGKPSSPDSSSSGDLNLANPDSQSMENDSWDMADDTLWELENLDHF